MPERPADVELERSTNKWMAWGLGLMVVMILAFPAYRVVEPANREDARETLTASLIEQGSVLWDFNCVACHGVEGMGGIAPALNSQQFLTAANDEQIATLIAVGVPGTSMQAYSLDFGGPLTLEQINALTTYIRSWEPDAPDNPNWREPLE